MDFDEINILNMADADFVAQFLRAIGAKPGDTIEIVTPQFERTGSVVPSLPDMWEQLRSLSVDTLRSIGCGIWDEPDATGRALMLFPKEWYDHIPEGFEVDGIDGERETFKRGGTDDDYRFGCLAYGVKVLARGAAERKQEDGDG